MCLYVPMASSLRSYNIKQSPAYLTLTLTDTDTDTDTDTMS